MGSGRGGVRSGPSRRPRTRVLVSVVAVLTALGPITPVVAGSVTGSDDDPSASRPTEGSGPRAGAGQPRASDPVPVADTAEARQAAEPMPLQELTADGGGRVYTLDLDEARTLSEEEGMTRTPRQVAFVPRGEFQGSQPLYRLRETEDVTATLVTADAEERRRLVADGWVEDGVIGHLSTENGPGRQRLLRFSDGGEWRLAPASRRAELVDAGYQVDGSLGYAWTRNVRAGALYFGMFNDVGGSDIAAATERYFGREGDWWGGVRDYRDGTHYATDNWPDADFSHLKPSIGYYDDSDPATLEKHITQAIESGLSFFDFYWYWDSEQKQENVTRKGLNAFLRAENRDRIDFTVGVCAHPWGGLGIPADQFDDVADVLVDKYLSLDNALRTNDGRRILNICDARGIGDGSTDRLAEFTQAVRDRAQSQLGERIYIMINQGSLDPSQVPAAGGDAAYCTTDGPGVESESYEQYLKGQRGNYDAAQGAYGRCVLTNFDERPRYPVSIPKLEEIRWMPDQTLAGYRQALRTAVTAMDESERPPEVDNLLFLYAWNEWHEGGVLEPNVAEGCAYLDATREELGLTSGSGCVADPGRAR